MEKWDWNKDNGNPDGYTIIYTSEIDSGTKVSTFRATKARCMAAYKAITTHGKVSDFHIGVWQGLVYKVIERSRMDGKMEYDWQKIGWNRHFSHGQLWGYVNDYDRGIFNDVYFQYPQHILTSPSGKGQPWYNPDFGMCYYREEEYQFRGCFGTLCNQLWPFTKGDPFWVKELSSGEKIFVTDRRVVRYYPDIHHFNVHDVEGSGMLKGEYLVKLAEVINNYIECTTHQVGCNLNAEMSIRANLTNGNTSILASTNPIITSEQIGLKNGPSAVLRVNDFVISQSDLTMQSHFDVFASHSNKVRTTRSFILSELLPNPFGQTDEPILVECAFQGDTGITIPCNICDAFTEDNSFDIDVPASDQLLISDSMRSASFATLQSGVEVDVKILDTMITRSLLYAVSDISSVMRPIDRVFFMSDSVAMKCDDSTVADGLKDTLFSSGGGTIGFGQPMPVLVEDSMPGTTERNILCTSPGLHTVATATSVIAPNAVFFLDPSIHYTGGAAERLRIVSDLQMSITVQFEASATEQIKAVINEPVTSYRVLPDSNLTIEDSKRALLQKDRAAHANSSITIQDVEQAIAIRDKTVDFNSNTTIDALSISGMGICMFENATGHVVEKGISNSEMYLQRIRYVGSSTNINETAIGKELTIKHGVDAFSATTTNVIIASNARTVRGLRHMRSNSKVLVSTYADADCSMYISAMGNVVVSERQSGRLLYQKPILFDAKTTVYDSESALVQFADRVSAEASAAVSHIIDADMETNITLNAVAAMSVAAYSNAILDKELPEGWINPRYVEDDVLLVRQLHYTFARYNLLYLDSLVARDTWAKPVLRLIAAADLVVANIYHPDTSKWIQPIPVDTELVFYQTHTPWQKKDTLFVDSALPLFLDANASARDVTTGAVFYAAPPVYAVGDVSILEKKKSDSDVHSDLWEYPEQRIRTLVVYQLHSVVQDENSLEVV